VKIRDEDGIVEWVPCVKRVGGRTEVELDIGLDDDDDDEDGYDSADEIFGGGRRGGGITGILERGDYAY